MGQALTITRTDHCAADLRAAASKSDDAAQVRRLLAIALALDGDPRSEAAERSGMDRQTLRDWVHRYNDGGIDGLKSRSKPGPRATADGRTEGGVEGTGHCGSRSRARMGWCGGGVRICKR